MNRKFVFPTYLKAGDKVMIVSTARKVKEAEIQSAIKQLTAQGLQVELGENLFAEFNQFAGTDEQRIADLQHAFDRDEIKAVMFARGGYGTVRIIDRIDFSRFQAHPKWLIGYSDITVLHAHVQQNFQIASMHSPMAFNYNKLEQRIIDSIHSLLFGAQQNFSFSANPMNRRGECSGILVGGNLSILYSLLGSKSDLQTNGRILFIEDLDEYLYHIDRMMMALKRAGKLANLRGLVVGGMSKMRDNEIPFGKSAEEIICEAVKDYDYPVCFDFPAGHIDHNEPLVFGDTVIFKCGETVEIKSTAADGTA